MYSYTLLKIHQPRLKFHLQALAGGVGVAGGSVSSLAANTAFHLTAKEGSAPLPAPSFSRVLGDGVPVSTFRKLPRLDFISAIMLVMSMPFCFVKGKGKEWSELVRNFVIVSMAPTGNGEALLEG